MARMAATIVARAGDEDGVPELANGKTGLTVTTMRYIANVTGKSINQRMPPGRFHRPDPKPPGFGTIFPLSNSLDKHVPKPIG